MPLPHPSPMPVGRTARRLEWTHLPPEVRDLVERRIGTDVVTARSSSAGYSPGLAAELTGADGTRHFVKAAADKAQRTSAAAYRSEAGVLAALREAPRLPVPGLRWVDGADEWVLLGLDHVAGATPTRPWSDDELDRCLDALSDLAERATPAPPRLRLTQLSVELADAPLMWDVARRAHDLVHAEEAAALSRRLPDLVPGNTLAHGGLHPDKLLLADDGRVLVCGWSGPVLGPAWLDALMLCLGARTDGLDVARRLATHPAFTDHDPEAVDVVLAVLAGYFLAAGAQRSPSWSPWLRTHQAWQGVGAWTLLAERRGWS